MTEVTLTVASRIAGADRAPGETLDIDPALARRMIARGRARPAGEAAPVEAPAETRMEAGGAPTDAPRVARGKRRAGGGGDG